MPEQKQYEISPLKLWSPLQRQLAACGLIKGSPQQWIGTIRNLQKKGVSAVEIEWSDVMRMLGDVPESERVFHELVALAASLSGESPPTLAEPLPSVVHVSDLLAFLETESPCELVLQRHVSNEYVPQVRYEKQQRPAKLPPAVVVHGRREVKLLHYRDRTFGICILLHLEVDTGLFAGIATGRCLFRAARENSQRIRLGVNLPVARRRLPTAAHLSGAWHVGFLRKGLSAKPRPSIISCATRFQVATVTPSG